MTDHYVRFSDETRLKLISALDGHADLQKLVEDLKNLPEPDSDEEESVVRHVGEW
jgi:hypothetical protein